jgi:hypothetical protein
VSEVEGGENGGEPSKRARLGDGLGQVEAEVNTEKLQGRASRENFGEKIEDGGVCDCALDFGTQPRKVEETPEVDSDDGAGGEVSEAQG